MREERTIDYSPRKHWTAVVHSPLRFLLSAEKLTIKDGHLVSRIGIFNRTTEQIPLHQISPISVEQSWLGRLLSYGHVGVSIVGGGERCFRHYRNPEMFHKALRGEAIEGEDSDCKKEGPMPEPRPDLEALEVPGSRYSAVPEPEPSVVARAVDQFGPLLERELARHALERIGPEKNGRARRWGIGSEEVGGDLPSGRVWYLVHNTAAGGNWIDRLRPPSVFRIEVIGLVYLFQCKEDGEFRFRSDEARGLQSDEACGLLSEEGGGWFPASPIGIEAVVHTFQRIGIRSSSGVQKSDGIFRAIL